MRTATELDFSQPVDDCIDGNEITAAIPAFPPVGLFCTLTEVRVSLTNSMIACYGFLFNATSSPGPRCGPFEPKRRRDGKMRSQQPET
jgi:hypothetical protein